MNGFGESIVNDGIKDEIDDKKYTNKNYQRKNKKKKFH